MVELGIFAVLITLGYVVGGAREKNHFQELKNREAVLIHKVPTRSDCGPKIETGETFLVTGNVVIATDYFKNFVGGLRNFFGGRMTSHESLLDRARREALVRMREMALNKGAHQVVDVHIETSFLDQMGAEVSAYGTAVK